MNTSLWLVYYIHINFDKNISVKYEIQYVLLKNKISFTFPKGHKEMLSSLIWAEKIAFKRSFTLSVNTAHYAF